MRPRWTRLRVSILVACTLAGVAHAADEDPNARVKEMLRRTQEALRQAQSDNADLMRAKTDAEQKRDAATRQIEAAQSDSKAAQTARAALSAKLSATQQDLMRKLEEANERLAAANARLAEDAEQLAARDAELTQTKQALEVVKIADAGCEDKNLRLYTYSEELLQAYKNKGVWQAMSQKEPVFGLKEVGIENVVQEYRLKLATEKISH